MFNVLELNEKFTQIPEITAAHSKWSIVAAAFFDKVFIPLHKTFKFMLSYK